MTVGKILDRYISLYHSAVDKYKVKNITIRDYFELITVKSGAVSNYVKECLENGKNSNGARFLKSTTIPCVTPSGVFDERNDAGLIMKYTRIVVLDLDAKDNVGINLEEVILDARYIDSTLAYHKSVSGEGYAIYVMVDKWQKNTYKFVMDYYTIMLGVTFDRATSNLSRLRYVSYDPNIWVASDVTELRIPDVVARKKKRFHDGTIIDRRSKSDGSIMDLIDVVISNGDDPTSDYADWFQLGCAIASEYGEVGRHMFHKVSSNYHSYDYEEVDKKYDSILRMGNYKSGKGSIVYILSKFQ